MLPWKADGKAVPRVSGRCSSRDGIQCRSAQRASARSTGRALRKQDAPMSPWSKEPLAVQGLRARLVPQNDNPARLPSLPEAGLLACQLGRVFTAPCLRPVRCQMDSPLCRGSSFRSSDSRGACSCHVQARAVDRPTRTVTSAQQAFFLVLLQSSEGLRRHDECSSSRTFFVFWSSPF